MSKNFDFASENNLFAFTPESNNFETVFLFFGNGWIEQIVGESGVSVPEDTSKWSTELFGGDQARNSSSDRVVVSFFCELQLKKLSKAHKTGEKLSEV